MTLHKPAAMTLRSYLLHQTFHPVTPPLLRSSVALLGRGAVGGP